MKAWEIADNLQLDRINADVEFVLKMELDSLKSERDKLASENADLIKRLNAFGVWGTDGCLECETGRITLFARGRLCPKCKDEALGKRGDV